MPQKTGEIVEENVSEDFEEDVDELFEDLEATS